MATRRTVESEGQSDPEVFWSSTVGAKPAIWDAEEEW
jgi:hypothetical protein